MKKLFHSKQFISLALALLMVFSSVAWDGLTVNAETTATTGENLIENGDFETAGDTETDANDYYAGWDELYGPKADDTRKHATTDGIDGSTAAEGYRDIGDWDATSGTASKYVNFAQIVKVEPGKTYEFTGYFKNNYATGQGYIRLFNKEYFGSEKENLSEAKASLHFNMEAAKTGNGFSLEDAEGTPVENGTAMTADAWYKFSYEFTVDEGVEEIKIILSGKANTSHFDNLSLLEVVEDPAPTEEPTLTPEPTEEPTATPESTEEPTATPEPTEEPTATPAPIATPDTGLILNGHFETEGDTAANEKDIFANWTETATSIENLFRTGYDGVGRAVRSSSSKYSVVSDKITVEAGAIYELSGYINMAEMTATDDKISQMFVIGNGYDENGNGEDYEKAINLVFKEKAATDGVAVCTTDNLTCIDPETMDEVTALEAGKWYKFIYQYTVDANITELELCIEGRSTGALIDNISLFKIETKPDTGLILNGHFETEGDTAANEKDIFANWTETATSIENLFRTGYDGVGRAVRSSSSKYSVVSDKITVEAGAIYELSGYINMAEMTATDDKISQMFVIGNGYDENGNGEDYEKAINLVFKEKAATDGVAVCTTDNLTCIDPETMEEVTALAAGKWYKFIYQYTVDANITELELCIEGRSTGALIDNISLFMVEEPVVEPEVSVDGEDYDGTLQEAITAAESNAVIKLLKDVDLGTESVDSETYFTLDLNGYTLTTTSFGKYVNVVDNSEAKTGLLKIAANACTLPFTNEQIPVYDTVNGGYVFADTTKLKQAQSSDVGADPFEIIFRPSFGVAKNGLLANGGTAAGISIKIRLNWTVDGVGDTQECIFVDDAVKDVYLNTKAFYIKAFGTESVTGLKITPYIESTTGVVYDLTTFYAN